MQYLFCASVYVYVLLLLLAFAWTAPNLVPNSAAQMFRDHLLEYMLLLVTSNPTLCWSLTWPLLKWGGEDGQMETSSDHPSAQTPNLTTIHTGKQLQKNQKSGECSQYLVLTLYLSWPLLCWEWLSADLLSPPLHSDQSSVHGWLSCDVTLL